MGESKLTQNAPWRRAARSRPLTSLSPCGGQPAAPKQIGQIVGPNVQQVIRARSRQKRFDTEFGGFIYQRAFRTHSPQTGEGFVVDGRVQQDRKMQDVIGNDVVPDEVFPLSAQDAINVR